MAKNPKGTPKQTTTLGIVRGKSGVVDDTQPTPTGNDDAFGQRRDFVPGVDSALTPRKGPKAARPSGPCGTKAELSPNE